MASVEELLMAARANRSPFQSLAEGLLQGVGQAQQGALERAKTLMAMDQARQEMEQQAEMRKQIKAKLASQQEAGITQAHAAVGAKNQPLPQQKLQEEISQDEKGRYSSKFKLVDTAPEKQEFEPKEYTDAEGRNRIGRWNKTTGTLEQSTADAFAKVATGVPDKSMERAITKAKVDLAKTRPMVDSVTAEIERVEKLNENSFGGLGGSMAMKAARTTGIGADSEKFKNTSDVVNTMQSQVAKVLKSTFGGQLSDGEREYLNGVYGALPSLTRSERAIAMKNVKSMLKAKLEGDDSTLNELLQDAGLPPNPTSDNETKNAGPVGSTQKIGKYEVTIEN